MLVISKNLTAEQRLGKATVAIIGRDEFVWTAGVLMIGKKSIDEKCPTAKTNGRDETYGRAFVDELTDPEFRFLILHECYHKLYRHLTTWKHLYDMDHTRANRACDYVINLKLAETNAYRDGWIKMPSGGLLDYQYKGMDAKQVFDMLDPDEGGGSGGSGDGSLDEHDWEGAQELSDEEKIALEKEIDEAIRQGATLAGKCGTGGPRDLGELLQAKVDWREQLREYVTTVCSGKDYSTWRKPNRRFIGMDIIMPSSLSETMGELVVAVDTSGSIGSEDLNNFLTEVKGICETVKPSKVHMIYWDTAVAKHETFMQEDLDQLVRVTKPAGGGGTDASCVPMYLNEKFIKPECVVMLTDGYLGGTWGQWSVPVLWCVQGNKSATAPTGVTIHI